MLPDREVVEDSMLPHREVVEDTNYFSRQFDSKYYQYVFFCVHESRLAANMKKR